MKPLEKYISEKRIKRTILDQRNQLWAGLLNQLNKDINFLKEGDVDVIFRMADWAELCARLLKGYKNSSETFKIIINGLKEEQSSQVLSHSIVPQILDKWRDRTKEWYSGAELYEEWKDTAELEHLTFFKSARGLAMHLRNIRRALRACYGVNYRSDGRVWLYQFPCTVVRQNSAEEGAADDLHTESEELCGGDS